MASPTHLVFPRIVHRIWLDEQMPAVFRRFGSAWKFLNPGWSLLDWDSPLPTTLMDPTVARSEALRQRAQELMPSDWKRFEADIMRLQVLYQFGGLYVDMDVEPHLPIDGLLRGKTVLVARSPEARNGYHAITNCVIAAPRRHPWIAALLDGLEKAVEERRGQHLANVIGPWHLDRMYSTRTWPDVTVVDWSAVKPYLTHYWNTRRRKRGEGIA